MIKKFKGILLSIATLFALGVPAFVPVVVSAGTIQGGVNCGAELRIQAEDCVVESTGATGLQELVRRIINIFSVIVGVIAVIMIIVGGLKYITSGGESSNVSGAKNTIIYAIVGLIIVALAQFIVRFVLTNTNNIAG